MYLLLLFVQDMLLVATGMTSATARMMLVMFALPAVATAKTEKEERDLNTMLLTALLVMLIVALVLGCWLGRCFTMMTVQPATNRGRDRGTMTDPVIAAIAAPPPPPPPPVAFAAPRRRVPLEFWTTPRGGKLHLDASCRTIRGHAGATNWTPCLVCADQLL